MAVNGWPNVSPTGAILNYAYIRFGGDNNENDIFPISISSIPNIKLSTEAGLGTSSDKSIYIRNAIPVSEFISQIALQIYSWSSQSSSDGNSTIGTARTAAHQAFERAEEYVKQLVNRKFITIEYGLIKWNMNVNDFIKNLN